jgi:CDP-diacylglycerol--glycerol-3-phosphate 3-phosphatidyltransferase
VASIYDLKPAFQNLLRPIVASLARTGVTANQVTVAALLLSVATGLLIATDPRSHALLLLVPLVLFVRMALNAIDGMLAREHGMKSPLGAVLNELGDVLADAALYLPFALVPGFDARLVAGIVVLAVISEMAGVVAVQIGATRRYDGPLGKSDRAFAFGLLALLAGLGIRAGSWTSWVLSFLLALAALTVCNRVRAALRELRRAHGH